MDSNGVQGNSLQPYSCSDRVELWVKHTQALHQRNIEENVGKRKHIPNVNDLASPDIIDVDDVDEDDDDDIERYSDDLMIWEKPTTEPRKKYRWNKFPLNFKCEWFDCKYENTQVTDFVKHVSYHIPDVEIRTDDKDNDVFVCGWNACGFKTCNDKELVRHVNFHSYHTKLKTVGAKMMEVLNISKCDGNPEGKNMIPHLPAEFSCEWEDCSRTFNNSQMFFLHVSSHMECYKQRRKKVGKVRDVSCAWPGCKAKFVWHYKLVEHVKVHTQEKLTACPTCGALYSSVTKLYDHCITRNSKVGFRCTSCFKYFASERLLRDHMRHHVNRYKCTFCDMTCPSPSSLSLHIRYRHLNSKPFKCMYCKFVTKTQRDLNTHLKVHEDKPSFPCPLENCDFSCRALATINKHMQDMHCGGSKPLYCCHICTDRFYNGATLTKHLFKYHKFQWTPGHTRFTYTRNEDGYFRLKPFRLETLEVTQEILQAEIDEHPTSISEVCGSHYSVRQFTQTDVGQGDSRRTRGKRKTVVISIDEIDKTGGVVHRKVIETEEVPAQRRGGAVVCNYSDGDVMNSGNAESDGK